MSDTIVWGVVGIAAVAMAAVEAAGGQRRKPKGVRPRAVVFKTVGKVQLRLFVYEPAGHKPTDRRPAIVFFFGGGWRGGSPRQFHQHSRYLASRGMVAMTAEYRVGGRHKVKPFKCVADAKSAVRWIRANAATLGIDPDRIAAGGGSAGGHLAAATAFLDGFDDPTDDATVSAKPNALVLFNPVIDTTPKGYGSERLGDQAEAMSPVHHVRKGAPPTIVFHGKADRTVPFENVQRFEKRMKAVGARCELMAFEGKGHGFFNYGRDGGMAYFESVRAADQFLVSLGYLEGPPTLEPPK